MNLIDNIKMRLALIWVALTKKYFFVTATSTFVVGEKKYCYENLPTGIFGRTKRNIFLEATSQLPLN